MDEFPLVWRLDKTIAGSESLGDLGAHSIDLVRFLVGEMYKVIGINKTFIKERPLVEKMDGLSAEVRRMLPGEKCLWMMPHSSL